MFSIRLPSGTEHSGLTPIPNGSASDAKSFVDRYAKPTTAPVSSDKPNWYTVVVISAGIRRNGQRWMPKGLKCGRGVMVEVLDSANDHAIVGAHGPLARKTGHPCTGHDRSQMREIVRLA